LIGQGRELLRKLLGYLERIRHLLLALALLYAAYLFAKSVQPHYPIRDWLVWRYAGYWLACLAFTVACLSAGQRVLRLLGRSEESVRAELVSSFALGVIVFFLAVFIAGLSGLLIKPTFFVLPVLLTLAGGRPALRFARRCARVARAKPLQKPTALGRALAVVATLLGVTALLLLYAQILPPENVSFDARWYHLGMAEQYVSEGAIRRFPEGAFYGAYPQLASILYTWAFLFPTGLMFDRVVLAAHVEFVLFLWTLVGVAVLVRRLVPRTRPRFAWLAVFLFPGFYVYDSSLVCGADHVVALFAAPIFLALLRALGKPSPRTWTLVGAFIAGACLTKYTAFTLVAFPALALVARCLWEIGASLKRRRLDGHFWHAPAALLASGLVLTAPHWLKNWIWYKNPIFPMAAGWFHNRPWSDEAMQAVASRDLSRWSPQGPFPAKLKETLLALYSFSFEPHDFPRMHGLVPVFGSLFTLCLFAMPFLRGTKRTWLLVIAAHLGVFAWYWTHHEDRYLQALVPWMAAAVAAVVALAWRTHIAARAAVLLLVGLQVAWSGDIPFLPAHRMLRGGPLPAAINLFNSGYRKDFTKRLASFQDPLSKALPPDAHLLLHEHNPRLGIQRVVVNDVPYFQSGLHYGGLAGPKALYDLLREMGVTHVAWRRAHSRGSYSFVGDALFFDFLLRHTTQQQTAGSWQVAALAEGVDEDNPNDKVLFLGCQRRGFVQGVYPRLALNVRPGERALAKPEPPIRDPDAVDGALEGVRYVLFHPKCFARLPASVSADFVHAATRDSRDGTQIWVRKPTGWKDRPSAPAPSARPARSAEIEEPIDPLDLPE